MEVQHVNMDHEIINQGFIDAIIYSHEDDVVCKSKTLHPSGWLSSST